MTVCPECGSKKVFLFRLDSDLGNGMGDYNPVNDQAEYTDEEWKMDACDRPDIELFHCLQCDHLWE